MPRIVAMLVLLLGVGCGGSERTPAEDPPDGGLRCPSPGLLSSPPLRVEGFEVAGQSIDWDRHPHWAVAPDHRLRARPGWTIEGATILEPANDCYGPYLEFPVVEGNNVISWTSEEGNLADLEVEGRLAVSLAMEPDLRDDAGRFVVGNNTWSIVPLALRDAEGNPLTRPRVEAESTSDAVEAIGPHVFALEPGEASVTFTVAGLSLTIQVLVEEPTDE